MNLEASEQKYVAAYAEGGAATTTTTTAAATASDGTDATKQQASTPPAQSTMVTKAQGDPKKWYQKWQYWAGIGAVLVGVGIAAYYWKWFK